LYLLREAEALARELGSPAFVVTAPFNGTLAQILPPLGYAETNRVFSKVFYDA
jgi:hypothetical protein